jgi:hypothetical protein
MSGCFKPIKSGNCDRRNRSQRRDSPYFFRSLAALDQEQESKCAGSETRSGGRLGAMEGLSARLASWRVSLTAGIFWNAVSARPPVCLRATQKLGRLSSAAHDSSPRCRRRTGSTQATATVISSMGSGPAKT